MSTPEQRFEVPPEYADVYERAYRRAYEEGQGQLGSALTEAPTHRSSARGKRIAVPEQRTSRRAVQQRSPAHLAVSNGLDRPGRVIPAREPRIPTPRAVPPAEAGPSRRAGHRATPRGGSTLYPLLALLVVMVLLVVGAFALGRATAGTVNAPDVPVAGTQPGATASAIAGDPQAASPLPAAGPYRGPMAPLRISGARADCTAPAPHAAYAARNVLDRDPRTAWGCTGSAVGRQLLLTLPPHSEVVTVGLVPGYGTSNQITKVAWIFDNGARVVQTMSGSTHDRSLHQQRIVAMTTDTLTLRILAVARGARDVTMIPTVRLDVSARGSD